MLPVDVLFICTANHFRSRFAEGLFNHYSKLNGLDLRAESCGFKPEDTAFGVSPFTASALRLCEAPVECLPFIKQRIHPELISSARIAVAMRRDEHYPLLRDRFPGWEARVRYWDVRDWPEVQPAEAFAMIREGIEGLIEELS